VNKFLLSCLLAALSFIVPVAVFIAPGTGNLESERRKIAVFPELPHLQSESVKKFFRGIDDFLVDHFPLRTPLLGLSVALYEAGGDNLDMDKSYRGKENWLFLGNNYGRCVDKLQGLVILSRNSLKHQTVVYSNIRDAAKNNGAEFFIFIGPNKSSIYPEHLPPVIIPARRRFISHLLESLNETGVKVYDPTARLVGEKSGGLLYYRTDTHWNARGAYEAFEGFRKWAGFPELPPLSLEEAPEFKGDLVDIGGYKNFPLSVGDNFTLHWSVPPSLHEEGGLIKNVHAASEKTVWVFGDSFARALSPYITATFKEVRFFWHGEFGKAISSDFPRPNMILWIIVERNFS
jgi:hypothetical protein